MAAWTDEETFLLIDLWGDEAVQALLEGCTRNRHVYERISGELEKGGGFKRSWSQCRDKLKKVKKQYKKIKDYHDETGRKRKEWKFFDKVDSILGCKPATRPEVVVDSSVEGTSSNIMNDNDDDGEVSEGEVSEGEAMLAKEIEKEDQAIREKDNEIEGKGDSDVLKEINKHERDKKPKVKQENPTKLDKTLKAVVNVISTTQRDSDKMYMMLEEKRMKLDESLLIMEDRRLREDKEREERQRKDEREFQLKMMMMLQKVSSPYPPQQPYPSSTFPPSSPYQLPSSQSPYPSPSPYPPSSPYHAPPYQSCPPSSPYPPSLQQESNSDQDN